MTESQVMGGKGGPAPTKVAVTGFERNLVRRHPCQLWLTMENGAAPHPPEGDGFECLRLSSPRRVR